jgi:anti-sigma B factor antagonist
VGVPSDSGHAAERERPFAVERLPASGPPGVLVRGELDLHSAPDLTLALDAAIRESQGAFVVDLCDVTFLDSSGVAVLVHARALLGRDDRDLVVVCPPGAVRRLFEVARIDDLFALFDSREEAAASLQPTT